MDRTPTNREQLREQVRQLLAEGASNREIARRLPVGKDTVRRWRAELETPAPADAPPGAPAALPARAASAEPAPPRTDELLLDLDAALREDLAVLAAAGLGHQAAVMYAVQLLADAYRYAWDTGLYDRGRRPQVRTRIVGGRDADVPPGMTLIRSNKP